MIEQAFDVSTILTQTTGYGLEQPTPLSQQSLTPTGIQPLNHPVLKGDANADGILNKNDFGMILGDRRTPISGPNDIRDFNSDGIINGLDVRGLTLAVRNNDDLTGPMIGTGLANDTTHDGGTNLDNITADPSISGVISDDSLVTRLWGSLNGVDFTDVTNTMAGDGSFSIDRITMEQIYDGGLGEGNFTFTLKAQDKWGNVSQSNVNFTMNRVIYSAVDMMTESVLLINTETDQMLQISLESLGAGENMYPGGNPQHAWITPDEKTIYLTSDNSPTTPSAITVISIGDNIDWSGAGPSDISISKVLILDAPGNPSNYPAVSQVDPSQIIAHWTQPPLTQIHGPTFLPQSAYTYMTIWTDNRFPVIDTRTNEFVNISPLTFGSDSSQTHTITFNQAATLGLGTGYYYDKNEIDLYSPNINTGELTHISSVKLQDGDSYGAFSHHMFWLDDRYIVAGALQLGPTSLTPEGKSIVGPSMWLIDTLNPNAPVASLIIPHVNDPDGEGIYRSPSDMAIVGNKLYVGEEDSLGDTFGRDGFVSVFDVTDIHNPTFIKRFKPGEELPSDFAVAHGIAPTPDGSAVYVTSYASNYIIKIDTATDTVVKIYGAADGLTMPHGELIAGNYR